MTAIIRSPSVSDTRRPLPLRSKQAPQTDDAEVHAGAIDEPNVPATQVAPDHAALVAQLRKEVLAQVKADAETLRELARQRGLNEGRKEGAEEAQEAAAAELARLRGVVNALGDVATSAVGGIEDVAVAIAFEAICKVLGEAAASREGIAAMVRAVCLRITGRQALTVRLHPADLDMLRSASALDALLPGAADVSWAASDEVELGGCLVTIDGGGTLDARLETQINLLRDTLMKARSARIP